MGLPLRQSIHCHEMSVCVYADCDSLKVISWVTCTQSPLDNSDEHRVIHENLSYVHVQLISVCVCVCVHVCLCMYMCMGEGNGLHARCVCTCAWGKGNWFQPALYVQANNYVCVCTCVWGVGNRLHATGE